VPGSKLGLRIAAGAWVCGLLAGLLPAQEPQTESSLSGTVVDATTGAPLPKAFVHLSPGYPHPGRNCEGNRSYSALTTSDGKFSFASLEPDCYAISVDRASYAPLTVGSHDRNTVGSSTAVLPGERLDRIVLKMQPQGVIAGHVLSGDGTPFHRVVLLLWQQRFDRGRKSLQRLNFDASHQDFSLDADGSFVLGPLDAGRYYLAARGSAITAYPDAATFAEAAPIDVPAGHEVRGIVLRLRWRPLFQIAGKVSPPPAGSTVERRQLWLEADGPAGSWTTLEQRNLGARAGPFEFRPVPAGKYRIRGILSVRAGNSMRTFTANQNVPVDGRDVRGLLVEFSPNAQIDGVARAEDQAQVFAPRSALASLWPLQDGPAGDFSEIGPDGTFHLQVPAGQYRTWAGNRSTGLWPRSVRFDGRDVTGEPLTISASGGKMEVTLSSGTGVVSGVVRDPQGIGSAGATVAVWNAQDVLGWDAADALGRFEIRGLPPGPFRLAAWEDLDYNLTEVPQFRAAFEGRAVAVSVTANSATKVNLSAIPRKLSAVEADKLK
jgi:Carboxypeptidase regulatory-like domain